MFHQIQNYDVMLTTIDHSLNSEGDMYAPSEYTYLMGSNTILCHSSLSMRAQFTGGEHISCKITDGVSQVSIMVIHSETLKI